MLHEVASELDVELNETIHRYRYATSFYDHDLTRLTRGLEALGWSKAYPNVSKSWTNRFQTIPTNSLCDDCYQGHENPHEAVLKDANPNDLATRSAS